MAACGFTEERKRSWIDTITVMMNEGEHILLRLPRVRMAILSHPEPLMWYRKKRVELELLQLKHMIRSVKCTDENDVVNKSDNILQR
ncbi:hypothetical protein DPMN_038406 [Dreissena polymorpha]|uniref:Uncharacterized protein n=1 Tax=Dreissena polymorpha TaxID=45954 RepID=A0A9D4RQ74_DREPO|nr:hypothetical protein DPMN_038406 [Dreissena polymorpha]